MKRITGRGDASPSPWPCADGLGCIIGRPWPWQKLQKMVRDDTKHHVNEIVVIKVCFHCTTSPRL